MIKEGKVSEVENKRWNPRGGEIRDPIGHEAAPNEPGMPIYKDWPKKLGKLHVYEYAHGQGIVKRVVVDIDGTPGPSAGDLDGYVGICPVGTAHNNQTISEDQLEWTSEWDAGGNRQRMVYWAFKDETTGQWGFNWVHQEHINPPPEDAWKYPGGWKDIKGGKRSNHPFKKIADIPPP